MATEARLTADDLWRLGEGDTRREPVDGEVREMAPAGGVHGEITERICHHRLAEHVEHHGGGEVLAGDAGFVLQLPHDPERVRAPDVAFVPTARLPVDLRTELRADLSGRFGESREDMDRRFGD